MIRDSVRRLWVGLLLLCCVDFSFAASQRELKLDELTELSEEIVVGRVVSTESRWEGSLIVTVASVEVSDSWKGRSPDRIEVLHLGGTAQHPQTGLPITMSTSLELSLQPEDELLLFLVRPESTARLQPGARRIVGGPQGRFAVSRDPRTAERRIPVGPKRLATEAPRVGGPAELATTTISLDAMRTRVRRSIEKAQGGRR